jgi:two-component system phosphate regulon sensor histidine kinase PhoR
MILLIIIFFAYTIHVMLRQKRLSEVKTDFINNMTHELKTPISTIGLSAEVLLKPDIIEQPERLHQYAEIITNENNRLKAQVDKVLQIASLSPDQVNIQAEELDMHEIIQKAYDSYLIQFEERHGSFVLNLAEGGPKVMGDRVHITNIVYNLLDNACKYTEQEPQIELTSAFSDGWFSLSVKDHGIGIERKHQKMIFEKFFRVPTGNVHNVKGFGLGLFYVMTIVKAHLGKLELESQPGKGSVFTVKLKLASDV